MNKFFEAIDKYKFGLLAVALVYMVIFMYLHLETVPSYYTIEAFHEGPRLEVAPEEIELLANDIVVPQNFQQSNIRNVSRDQNDQRERSSEDFSKYTSPEQAAKDVYELEKQMFAEAGGEAERERLRKEMADRQNAANQSKSQSKSPDKGGEGKVADGNVMVDWNLKDRNPHQGNSWYVRNPGYTCGEGSGLVVILIKVNQNGTVIAANYDDSRSSGANQCMIDQARKYALKSRFNYSGKSPKSQNGTITYTFISQ